MFNISTKSLKSILLNHIQKPENEAIHSFIVDIRFANFRTKTYSAFSCSDEEHLTCVIALERNNCPTWKLPDTFNCKFIPTNGTQWWDLKWESLVSRRDIKHNIQTARMSCNIIPSFETREQIQMLVLHNCKKLCQNQQKIGTSKNITVIP